MKNRKKISQYIMTFAFFYSSILCFSEANNKWLDGQLWLSILILISGLLSFLAVFRWQISDLINWIRKLKNEK